MDAACDVVDDEDAEIEAPPPNAENMRRLRSKRLGCVRMARNIGAEDIGLLPAAAKESVVLIPTAPQAPAVKSPSARGAARGANVLRSCVFSNGTPGVDGNDENDESDSGLSTTNGLLATAC